MTKGSLNESCMESNGVFWNQERFILFGFFGQLCQGLLGDPSIYRYPWRLHEESMEWMHVVSIGIHGNL